MNSRIPLYLSALALFIIVIGSLFFFNQLQKMKKFIKELRIDKNAFVNLSGKVDMLYSDLKTIENKLKQTPQKPSIISKLNYSESEASDDSADESEASESEVSDDEDSDDEEEVDLEEETLEKQEEPKTEKPKEEIEVVDLK